MPEVLQVGISWEYDNRLLLSSSKEIWKILHVQNFLFELLFRLRHVSWHSLIPEMVHQDLTDFLTDWGDGGDA